jgi:hypothetical protein
LVINDPNGVEFWTRDGKGDVTPRLSWDGKSTAGVEVESATDYPYILSAIDSQGQSAEKRGVIPIDVLVIRDGNKLRIRVPAIIFRANNADFVNKAQDPKRGLTPEVITNNDRVLSRVADILQKFRDYKVSIEGHANSETGRAEEEKELVPLSQKRAEFVRDWLVSHGVAATRLSAVGMGGKKPVSTNIKDRANWWKNRRVEFILER